MTAFDEVFKKYGKDIKIVLHTASPVTFQATDLEKGILIPAVNGVKSILNAILKYAPQTVERFVYTSSVLAQVNPTWTDFKNVTINEKSWNDSTWEGSQVDSLTAYSASKAFAERAAWDFMKEYGNEVKFKLTTVLPSFVFGPEVKIGPKLNLSGEILKTIIHATSEKQLPSVDTVLRVSVDVRDVARAHMLAFQKEECIGKRLSLVENVFTLQDILDLIHTDFPDLSGNVPVRAPVSNEKMPKELFGFNNDESKKILGFKFYDFKTSVHDSIKQILDAQK